MTVRSALGASALGVADRTHHFDSARLSRWVWVGYDDDARPHRDEIERIGPYSCRARVTLTDPEEIIDWVEKASSARLDTWLISHSASSDLHLSGLLDALKSERWRFDSRTRPTPSDPDADIFSESSPSLQVLADPPTILSLRVLGIHRLICLDSRNFWNVSLPELAESLGIAIPQAPDPLALDRLWDKYLDAKLRPVELAFLRMVDWLDRKKFGRARFSSAGVAMQAFRTAHLPTTLYPSSDEEVRTSERAICYAGEVRTWRLGQIIGPVHHLDVSSLYPAQMREHAFPVKALAKLIGGPWRAEWPKGDLTSVSAEVFIRDYQEAWPIKTETGTRFVRGTFSTWLAGPELDEAVRKGIVLGWRSLVLYQTANLFRSWVDDLWDERMAAREIGDKVSEGFAKMLLNSLYGKFGQRGGDLIERTDFLAGTQWGRWVTTSATTGRRRVFQVMNGHAWEEVGRKELKRSLPAITGWVTALGRRRMRELRGIAGAANVFYQGVDSLLVSAEGTKRLEQAGEIAQNELGKLRYCSESEHCVIRGWGDYEIGDKRTIQGIKADAVQLSDRRFEFGILDHLRRHLFMPSPRFITETRRVVTLPQESIIGTTDAEGRVMAPLRREPIPDELLAALKSIGSPIDFDSGELDNGS